MIGVSSSGYYSWKAAYSEREARHKALVEQVRRIYLEGKGHYGAERICGVIRRGGGKASFGKVKAIMDEHHWVSSHCKRRSWGRRTGQTTRDAALKNQVKGLAITRPFQVLTSDISHIQTGEGVEYLCQIRDVYSNVVLGFTQQSRKTADIVLKAVASVRGRWQIPSGAIFHSDRGSQYTAREVTDQLRVYGFQLSYSDVGKPGDNPWSESFFSVLKKEIIHRRPCASREEARMRVFEYIETYYNGTRAQKRLGYTNPIQYLNHWQTLSLGSLP